MFVLSMHCFDLATGVIHLAANTRGSSSNEWYVASAEEGTTKRTEAWTGDVDSRYSGPSKRVELPPASHPSPPGTNTQRKEYTDGGIKRSEARFLGINIGDENTNFQAGMWLLGLVGVLAAALPVVFLDASLGYRRKRNIFKDTAADEVMLGRLLHAQEGTRILYPRKE